MYCKMINAIGLVNTSNPLHNYHYFFVVITFKTTLLKNFQEYNTVLLTVVTKLYNRYPRVGHLYLLTSIFLLTPRPPAPSNHYSTLFL